MPSRRNDTTLGRAHAALLERTLISRSDDPDLFRLVGYHFAAIAAWHSDHTGWQVRRVADTVRMERPITTFVPGYAVPRLKNPRDLACFAWTLWYAERRVLGATGSNQFLLSHLAEQVQQQSQAGDLAPHAAPLDFRNIRDRYSLRRALEALQDVGGLHLVDSGGDWAAEGDTADALYEFTDVVRALIAPLDGENVVRVGRVVERNGHTLRPLRLPQTDAVPPLQRAWRGLLVGPVLLRYDDPDAFEALLINRVNVEDDLAATYGWALDVRQDDAAAVRPGGTAYGGLNVLNLNGAHAQAALLCCGNLRQSYRAGRIVAREVVGCLLLAESQLADIFDTVRARDGENWGSTARKTPTAQLRQEVYAAMREAGLMRGPDRDGNVLMLPMAARFEVGYDESAAPKEVRPATAEYTPAMLDMVDT